MVALVALAALVFLSRHGFAIKATEATMPTLAPSGTILARERY